MREVRSQSPAGHYLVPGRAGSAFLLQKTDLAQDEPFRLFVAHRVDECPIGHPAVRSAAVDLPRVAVGQQEEGGRDGRKTGEFYNTSACVCESNIP